MAHFDSYVICTSPRSGSTLLCSLLAATGVCGNPQSWFHERSISGWLENLGLSADATRPEREVLALIFKTVAAKGSVGTDMFGLRLQRQSFDFFTRKLAVLYPGFSSDAGRFKAAFGRTLFVYLTRRDKVEQAVSYVRAHQSGLWHMAPDGTELERLSAPQEPVYNADEIRARYEALSACDREWERWFAAEGIDPFRITYETLSSDPAAVLRRILDRLGLDRKAAAGVEPGTAKLADGASRDWVARFRREPGVSRANRG